MKEELIKCIEQTKELDKSYIHDKEYEMVHVKKQLTMSMVHRT